MERVLEPEYMDTAEETDGYDAMDHSGPNASFVERLVDLGARGRLLDLGTGPGHIPLLVCEAVEGAEVVATDAAHTMLVRAAEHRAESPHARRVQLVRCDAKRLPIPSGAFDAVYSNTILHHIPDPAPFLREAVRVLRPGGALLIRDLFRPESPAQRDELVELYAGDEAPANRELFRASLHAALTVPELRALADGAGLGHAELVVDTDRHMSLQVARRN